MIICQCLIPLFTKILDTHLGKRLQPNLNYAIRLKLCELEFLHQGLDSCRISISRTDQPNGFINTVCTLQDRTNGFQPRTILSRFQCQLMIVPTFLIISIQDPSLQNLTRCEHLRFVIGNQHIPNADRLLQTGTGKEFLYQSFRVITLLIFHDESNATRCLSCYFHFQLEYFRKLLNGARLIFLLDGNDFISNRLTCNGNRKRSEYDRVLIYHTTIIITLPVLNDLILCPHLDFELCLIKASLQIALINDIHRNWRIRINLNFTIRIIQHLQSGLENIFGVKCTQPGCSSFTNTLIPLHQNIGKPGC